jgi:hypothetical protein
MKRTVYQIAAFSSIWVWRTSSTADSSRIVRHSRMGIWQMSRRCATRISRSRNRSFVGPLEGFQKQFFFCRISHSLRECLQQLSAVYNGNFNNHETLKKLVTSQQDQKRNPPLTCTFGTNPIKKLCNVAHEHIATVVSKRHSQWWAIPNVYWLKFRLLNYYIADIWITYFLWTGSKIYLDFNKLGKSAMISASQFATMSE